MDSNGITLTDYSPDDAGDWPWWRVREELARRGLKLSDVGRKAKVTVNAVSLVAYEPRMRLQAIIGDLLGINPRQIWPSRYADDGRPLATSEWRSRND